MAQHGVPPLRPDPFCALRSDSGVHVLVFNIHALHALPKTMGTKTVSLLSSTLVYDAKLTTAQHNTSPLHGPNLFDCIILILPLLPSCGLFRDDTRLL